MKTSKNHRVNYLKIKEVKTLGKLMKPCNIFAEMNRLCDHDLNVKSKMKTITSCCHTGLSENVPPPTKEYRT